MLADARRWHASGIVRDKPHPVTGALALHVAAAKGYLRVIK
jgi:protein phosphatase 1 regulatory subunit 12A